MPLRTEGGLWGRRLLLVNLACWATAPAIGFEKALLAATLVGFLAAIVGLRRPVLGLLGIGMLSSLEPIARVFLQKGGLLRWNSFNYLLLVAMVLAVPMLLRLHDVQSRLLIVLIFLLGLEITISPNRGEGVQVVLEVVSIFGLIVFFRKGARGRRAWYWLGVTTGVSSALATLAFYSQQGTLDYINPNAMADTPLAGLFGVCLAVLFAQGRLWSRSVLMVLASLNVSLIFLSGSRGALSMACIAVLFLLARLRLSFRLTLLLAAAVLAGFIVKAHFVEQEERAAGRVGMLFDANRSLGNRTSGRINLAMGGWYIFQSNPLGVGTGGFASNYARLGNLQGLGRFREGQEMQAHSEWVKILTENGILGAILLGAFVLSFAATGWTLRRQGLFPVGLVVTATLAVGFFSREFQDEAVHLLVAGVMTLFQRASIARAEGDTAPRSLGVPLTRSFNSESAARRFLPSRSL